MRPADYDSGDGRVRMWLGDSTRLIQDIEADCVVSDPPYGLSHRCNFAERGRGETCGKRPDGKAVWSNPRSNDYPDVHGDALPFNPQPILDMGIPTVLFGGNHFADKLPASGGWLVWDKLRPDDLDQATCELAWTNCVKGVRRFVHLWNGMMRDSERGENYHPTQKPVALFDWIMSLRWIPDGTIFDPYMGAGPCGVAAIRSGRSFCGVEIEPRYFEIAVKRIERALAEDRQSLFPAVEPPRQTVLWEENQ